MAKKDKDFDFLVKSALDGAELPAPDGSWEAIASRLAQSASVAKDGEAAPLPHRSGPAVFRLAWTGLAAAAALALFFLLAQKSSPDTVKEVVYAVSEPETTTVTVPETITVLSRLLADNVTQKQLRSDLRAVHENLCGEKMDDTRKGNGPEVHDSGNSVTVAGSTAIVENPPSESDSGHPDPFVSDEPEQGRKRSPAVKLALSGMMQGNGNPVSSPGFSGHRSSGTPLYESDKVLEKNASGTYSIPVSAGLGIKIDLGGGFAVGSGFTWTYLERAFSGEYIRVLEDGTYTTHNCDRIRQVTQYAGIPLNLYYSPVSGKGFDFYVFAGGSVEKALSNRFSTVVAGQKFGYGTRVRALQWSVAAGLGVELEMLPWLGLYLDPSLRYYFACEQPKSIRTQQQLQASFEAGLRFKL